MASVWMYAKVMDWLSACGQKGRCVGCGEVRSCREASVSRASDTWIFSTVLVNESSLLFPNMWHRRETVPSAMNDTKPYILQGGCPTFLTI